MKMVVYILKMGLGVSLCLEEGVKHLMTLVPKNGYPKLILQKEMAFKII